MSGLQLRDNSVLNPIRASCKAIFVLRAASVTARPSLCDWSGSVDWGWASPLSGLCRTALVMVSGECAAGYQPRSRSTSREVACTTSGLPRVATTPDQLVKVRPMLPRPVLAAASFYHSPWAHGWIVKKTRAKLQRSSARSASSWSARYQPMFREPRGVQQPDLSTRARSSSRSLLEGTSAIDLSAASRTPSPLDCGTRLNIDVGLPC